MSNKRKKSKKHQKKSKQMPPVIVPQRKVVPLESVLERIYNKEDLSTVCLRQCTCCRVACPQMKFSEASSIIDHIWSTWSKEDKKKILASAVSYFFSDSLIKPCLMLDGNGCKIYDQRPLNCRLYGLWPSESWEQRVEMFAKSTGLPREKLPLNTQCPNVRRKPKTCELCGGDGEVPDEDGNKRLCSECDGLGTVSPPPLTQEQINSLFEALDRADMVLGVSELKVSTSWNYRTFHDWVLLKFWGESNLAKWTNIVLTTTPEQRQGIVEAFLDQVDNLEV